MSRLRTAYENLRDGGVDGLARETIEWYLREPRPSEALHWRLGRRYYGSRTAADRAPYDAPPDPFKLEWVRTDRIVRHTRRTYPPYKHRQRRFGSVVPGDWDRRDRPPIDPTYDGAPAELFVADRFSESVLYRSLRQRFVEDAAWTETPLYETTRKLLETGDRRHVWHGCRSEAELHDRFAELAELYADVAENGLESAYTRLEREGGLTVPAWLRGEIAVDVGRDGELFLVCGKHRFTVASLLGVSHVPVLFLARHPNWMTYRDRVASGEAAAGAHPDLRALRRRGPSH
ncbi:hypothetical protein [Natronococcus roseus]|uniref:hypothetical protein n=1 Tax=Natronococcus roseus TaxID=1052014 RepID=UPI00374D570F